MCSVTITGLSDYGTLSFQARSSYITGRHEEAELYSSKSRGTACYAIAIGIGLGVGYGVLLGLGYRFGWF